MFHNEIIRVIRHRYIWGIIILCMILNGLYLLYVDTDSSISYKYKGYWESVMDSDISDPAEYFEGKKEEVESEEPETEELEAEERLYTRMIRELELIDSYKDYRKGIYENARKISVISKVAGDGFAEKNNKKTYEHFRNMEPVEVSMGPSLGIEKLYGVNTATFMLVIILVVGYILYTEENESGIRQLTYVTACGKSRLFAVKYLTHITCMVIVTVIMYACNYIILENMYGFGDVNRSIQSVPEYRSCGSIMNIREYIILGLLMMIFLYAAITAILDCICIVVGGTIPGIITVLLFFSVCGLININIPLNSAYSPLKYLDPIFCTDAGQIIGKYINLNLFGIPVSYVTAVIVFYTFAAVVCLMLANIRFAGIETGRAGFKNFTGLRLKTGSHVSVFRHEMYKISKASHLPVILIICLITAVLMSHKDRLIFNDENEYYYYTYMKKIEGGINDEKNEYLIKESERFDNLNVKLEKCLSEGNEKEALALGEELRPYAAFQRVMEMDDYLKKNELDSYIYGDGYIEIASLFGNTDNRMLMLLGMIMLIIPLSGVFALDYETGQKMLYKTTYKGRRISCYLQYVCSFIICVITYLIVYIPQIIVHARLYGFDYIGESVACLNVPVLFGDGVPIWLWIVGSYALKLALMLIFGFIVLLLSKKIKNRFITMCVSGVVVLVVAIIF